MAKLTLPYVNSYRDRHGRLRHYFRRGAFREALNGLPGSPAFMEDYGRLITLHATDKAPTAVKRHAAGRGTLAWVIQQYRASKLWREIKPASQGVYERRLQYLEVNFGVAEFASFDERGVRAIRNKLLATPSVADATVAMVGRLWRFAKEHLDVPLGPDPTREVANVHTAKEHHTAWPEELCSAIERHKNPMVVRAYFLLRYTAQRRSDVARMKAAQFDGTAVELFQVKTGTFVWMPAHRALREHLATTGIDGEYLLQHARGPFSENGLSRLIRVAVEEAGFPGYSPHGLRHLAGSALAEAGASIHEIMAVLGHKTPAQAMEYTEQANRKKLATGAMAKWSPEASID